MSSIDPLKLVVGIGYRQREGRFGGQLIMTHADRKISLQHMFVIAGDDNKSMIIEPSPDGWVDWQDNNKMGTKDGKLVPIVQEYVLNTYIKYDRYDVKAADDYWAATKDYWAAVRAEWDRIARVKGGIAIDEEAQTGTVISGRLLQMADEVQEKKLTTTKAIAEAKKLIETNTRRF